MDNLGLLVIIDRTTIMFPDTKSLADFLVNNNISEAEANTNEQTLVAPLSEDDIITACGEYGGHLNPTFRPINTKALYNQHENLQSK